MTRGLDAYEPLAADGQLGKRVAVERVLPISQQVLRLR
jgi:hypothetical protein